MAAVDSRRFEGMFTLVKEIPMQPGIAKHVGWVLVVLALAVVGEKPPRP